MLDSPRLWVSSTLGSSTVPVPLCGTDHKFQGAIAVGDLVKSTLGPKGMDKILQSA